MISTDFDTYIVCGLLLIVCLCAFCVYAYIVFGGVFVTIYKWADIARYHLMYVRMCRMGCVRLSVSCTCLYSAAKLAYSEYL